MALPGHELYALVESGIAQRDSGVSAVEQLIDGFTLFEPGAGAVLPQDRRGVGQCALEPLMAAQQGAVAQLQPLVKDLPEFFDISLGAEGHIGKVDGDHTLIEAAVILGLVGLRVHIGGQEAAAAHAGIAVAAAVFINLQLQHFFLGDIVRYHAAGSALGGKLRQIVIGSVRADIILL